MVESQTMLLGKSRAAPAHARSPFSTYQEVPEGGEKSEEKQTCLLSQENAAGTLGSVN